MCCNCLCKWLNSTTDHPYKRVDTNETVATDTHNSEGRSTSFGSKSSVERRTRNAAEQTFPKRDIETHGYGSTGQSSPLNSRGSVDRTPSILIERTVTHPAHPPRAQSTSSLATQGNLVAVSVIPPTGSLGSLEGVPSRTPPTSADTDNKDIAHTPPPVDAHNAWRNLSSTETTPAKTPKSVKSSPEKEMKW